MFLLDRLHSLIAHTRRTKCLLNCMTILQRRLSLFAKDLIKMVLPSNGHTIIMAGANLDVSETYEQVKSLLAVSSIG